MLKLRAIFRLLLVLALLPACEPAAVIELHTGASLQAESSRSVEEIAFYSSRAWTAVSDVPWITLSPSGGEAGEARVTAAISANVPKQGVRTGTVAISSGNVEKLISVTQKQKDVVTAASQLLIVKPQGDTLLVEVSHNVPLSSVVVEPGAEDWIKPIATRALSGTQLCFNISCNDGMSRRTGKIKVTGGGQELELVVSQEVYELEIPSKGFLEYLLLNFDIDHDGAISLGEALQVTRMEDISSEGGIFSLEGIGFFRNLTVITCGWSARGFRSLDLSGLHHLQKFVGEVGELDVSGCPELEELVLTGAVKLDVSHNPKLRRLAVGWSDSLQLDLHANRELESVVWNSIGNEVLDLSGFPALREVNGNESRVKLLVHDCPSLEILHLSGRNSLGSLDLRGCPSLRVLECGSSSLSELILGDKPCLERVDLFYNQLPELDFSACPNLEWVDCAANCLECLSVRDCASLRYLDCSGQSVNMKVLDLGGCVSLDTLECYGNKLESLDLQSCFHLKRLMCHSNSLVSLDVSHCSELRDIWCGWNDIAQLDFSHNPDLYELHCVGTAITTLDLMQNLNLGKLFCFGCPNLTSVYLAGHPSENVLSWDGQTVIYIDGVPYP